MEKECVILAIFLSILDGEKVNIVNSLTKFS